MAVNLDGLDDEVKKKVQNLQALGQSLEFLAQQKIQIDTNLREVSIAIEELEKLEDDSVVYKSIGGILVKAEKNRLLDEKKSDKISLDMRSKSLKQKEERTRTQYDSMRKNIQAEFQGNNQ